MMRLVSLVDPALDIVAMGENFRPYIDTRDETLVATVPGGRLQWFVLRGIPSSAWSSFVSIGASDAEQRRRAFIMAVDSVENLVDLEGKLRAGVTKGTQRFLSPTGERTVWSDKEVDELFAPSIVDDIGEVARVRAVVPFGFVGRLRPPPSSLRALLAMVRHRAADMVSLLDLSEPLKETPTAAPSDDGDGPTDAPATGNQTESPDEPPTP